MENIFSAIKRSHYEIRRLKRAFIQKAKKKTTKYSMLTKRVKYSAALKYFALRHLFTGKSITKKRMKNFMNYKRQVLICIIPGHHLIGFEKRFVLYFFLPSDSFAHKSLKRNSFTNIRNFDWTAAPTHHLLFRSL